MVSLTVVFYMYVILFAIIGGIRGWAKEILVSFSVVLALALIALLEQYVSFVKNELVPSQSVTLFWMRSVIVFVLVFFGYQTPNIPRFLPKMTRERLEHSILGVVIGAINGYLIAGSIWFYLADAKYPFPIITPPDTTTQIGKVAADLLQYMPPRLLGDPGIFFAVVIAFIFVIVVFV
jgi:lysylphosphatidylglycerol synthetase-like protein (DUF2156 family)